jgi:hypothetical protein
MINLDRITAVCWDGRPLTPERSDRYHAIFKHMSNNFKFASINLYINGDFSHEGVNITSINQSSIDDYNAWCQTKLADSFNTEYVLVFQDDGFPINANNWTDEFYDYDYIGAPWPLYIGWPKENFQVGNGGFSLRSKRLCARVQSFPVSSSNEDAVLCSNLKPVLEKEGFKWASVDVAKRFAIEFHIDENHTLDSVFGFHGNVHNHEISKILF